MRAAGIADWPRFQRRRFHDCAPAGNRVLPPVRRARHRAARVELGQRPRRRREERGVPRKVQAARQVPVGVGGMMVSFWRINDMMLADVLV